MKQTKAIKNKKKLYTSNGQPLTHAYVHLLADVHFAGFAPVPIASVVTCKRKKDQHNTLKYERN